MRPYRRQVRLAHLLSLHSHNTQPPNINTTTPHHTTLSHPLSSNPYHRHHTANHTFTPSRCPLVNSASPSHTHLFLDQGDTLEVAEAEPATTRNTRPESSPPVHLPLDQLPSSLCHAQATPREPWALAVVELATWSPRLSSPCFNSTRRCSRPERPRSPQSTASDVVELATCFRKSRPHRHPLARTLPRRLRAAARDPQT